MTTEELLEKLELIQRMKCETSTLEIKSAEQGCPKHLYDSLSSFSNSSRSFFRSNLESSVIKIFNLSAKFHTSTLVQGHAHAYIP